MSGDCTIFAELSWLSLRTWPLVSALILILAIGSAVLYLPQSSRLRRRWRWSLTGLRWMAMVAVAGSFLQPILTRRPKSGERGAIVLMVDRSPSMGVHDRQRRPAQWVMLADGLGLLPQGSRAAGDDINQSVSAAQARLAEVSDAQSELAYALLSGHSTTDATTRLAAVTTEFNVSVAALMTHRPSINPKAPLSVALLNLKEQLDRPRTGGYRETWISPVRAGLVAVAVAAEAYQTASDEKLFNSNPAVRSICGELQNLSRLGLVEQAIARPETGLLYKLPSQATVFGFAIGSEVTPLPLHGGGRPVRRLPLDPQSGGTDLAGALREGLDSLGGVPVEAVVLFSDGRRTSDKHPGEAAGRSAMVGVPVYAVAVAPKVSSMDWSLSHIAVPNGVYAGEKFTVHARVHGVAVKPGVSTEVRAEVDSALSPSPPKRIALGPDLSADVEFDLRIDEPGSHRISLRLPELPGEMTPENNAVERWVKVYPQKLKVALLTTSPGWDYRYLRDALEAQAGVALHSEAIEDDQCSLMPEAISRQDAIVLFDVAATALSTAQWDAVKAVVAKRGGLAVLVAGAEHLPEEYAVETFSDLLPYRIGEKKPLWRTWQGEDPVYRFSPANNSPHRLSLAETDSANQQAWASLPPLFRYMSLPPLKPIARALLSEQETKDPVITEMPLGAGHVLFIGLEETWRWRHKTGHPLQESIWLQMLRHWTESPYAVATDRLALDIGKASVGPGETVGVRVKIIDPPVSIAQMASIEIRVLREGVAIRSQTIIADPNLPTKWVGTLLGLPAGDYVLEARALDQSIQYPLHVGRQYDTELEDPSGDRAALERIAKASGGRVIPLEQLRELPALLAAVTREPRWVTLALWDSTYLFVFVVACFSAEWALRKRFGLA